MKSNPFSHFAAILAASALVSTANAAELTWDSAGASPTAPLNGPGNWNTTDARWSNGTSDLIWNNATNDTAVFGGVTSTGTAGIVALGTGITVGNLTFNVADYKIEDDTLTFDGISSTIALTAGTTTIASQISGPSPITISNTGTLIFSNLNTIAIFDNDYTGGTTINTGVTLQVGAGEAGTITGPYTTLGTNAVTINSGGILKMWTGTAIGNTYTYANPINLNGGALNNQDGNYIFTGPIALGTGSTSSIRSQYGNKTVTLSGNVTGDDTAKLNLGNAGTGNTLMAMSGNNSVGSVGINGSVALTIGGGALKVAKNFFVGNKVESGAAGNASVIQTAGTVTLSSSAGGFGAGLNIGYQGPSTTSYTLSGGKLDVLTGVVSVSQGGSTNATLAISGTGVATMKGLGLVGSPSGTASINLTTGGRLNIGSSGITQFQAAGTKNINLGAGTVGAFADWSSSLNMKLTDATTGVTFDTLDSANLLDPRTITLSGVLSGATFKLNKIGVGTLLLNGANTYTGLTTVSGGVLGGTGSLAGPLTVEAGGTLAPGASVGTFTVGGNTTLAGTYACEIDGITSDLLAVSGDLALGGGLTVSATAPTGTQWTIATYTGALTGAFASVPSGYTVTATSGVVKLVAAGGNTYATWISGYSVAGQTAATDDFDNDGLDNSVENVLGSNPSVSNTGLTAVSATGTSFRFQHSQSNTIATDVTKTYQFSTDLIEWKASGETTSGGTKATISAVPITNNAPANEVIEVTVTVTAGPAVKVFARLVATQG